ncbi:MAG: hypothetical protein ACR2NN_24315 [Bryobacteraceae bacterium]
MRPDTRLVGSLDEMLPSGVEAAADEGYRTEVFEVTVVPSSSAEAAQVPPDVLSARLLVRAWLPGILV